MCLLCFRGVTWSPPSIYPRLGHPRRSTSVEPLIRGWPYRHQRAYHWNVFAKYMSGVVREPTWSVSNEPAAVGVEAPTSCRQHVGEYFHLQLTFSGCAGDRSRPNVALERSSRTCTLPSNSTGSSTFDGDHMSCSLLKGQRDLRSPSHLQ